jgi:hypothetical protein
MRALFPPPPFTPSHPVFVHLSLLAADHSQALRSAAEERISAAVRNEISEVEHAEVELRRHVEAIWKTFMDGVHKFEQTANRPPVVRKQDTETSSGTPTSGTPVAIRDFVPLPVAPAKTSQPAPGPKVSSLSASLATSSFHHPNAMREQASPKRSGSHSSASSGSPLRSDSIQALPSPSASLQSNSLRVPASEGVNVLQFKRNTDDAINTAVSFRYFTNLEADISRHKRENQNAVDNKQKEAGRTQDSPSRQAAQVAGPSTTANRNKKHKRHPLASQSSVEDRSSFEELKHEIVKGSESHNPENDSPSKAKRKVTFNVQPAVVTIKREMNAEKEEESKLAGQGLSNCCILYETGRRVLT